MGGRGCGGQPWCHEVRRVTPRQVRGVVSPAALATLRKIKRAQKRRARCEEYLVILYHKKIYWVATRRENSCEPHTMSWEEWRRHAYRKNRLRSGNDSEIVWTRDSWDMGKLQNAKKWSWIPVILTTSKKVVNCILRRVVGAKSRDIPIWCEAAHAPCTVGERGGGPQYGVRYGTIYFAKIFNWAIFLTPGFLIDLHISCQIWGNHITSRRERR